MTQNLPALIVFDLDFTLWSPEMYELNGGAPFRKHSGKVYDKSGEEVTLFPDVHAIFHTLTTEAHFKNTTKIAVASRTHYPHWARECLQLLHIHPSQEVLSNLIHYQAIYPENKQVHFDQLRSDSGVEYDDMLFFDNAYYNIEDVQQLGITSIYCPNGLTQADWEDGLAKFHLKKASGC